MPGILEHICYCYISVAKHLLLLLIDGVPYDNMQQCQNFIFAIDCCMFPIGMVCIYSLCFSVSPSVTTEISMYASALDLPSGEYQEVGRL